MSRTVADRPADDQSPSDTPPADKPVGHDGARVDVTEARAPHLHGGRALLAVLAPAVLTAALAALALALGEPVAPVPAVLAGLAALATLVLLGSLRTVQPGQTRVVQFFGRYTGTVREPGLVMVVPLSTTADVSVRVRNFETGRLKVNDATGSPVEVAAIVVWQVADTAQSTFAVEDYAEFVEMQSESALRHVVTTHPYDDRAGGTSLRGSTDVVADELAHEVAARVTVAGVEVVEVRITHLAYAPEIAQAMLQRQQASAIVAAREEIVSGAVGMVELALARLQELDVVELDEERKAAMVSNLLVVLCGDGRATPVVNTGTLYG